MISDNYPIRLITESHKALRAGAGGVPVFWCLLFSLQIILLMGEFDATNGY